MYNWSASDYDGENRFDAWTSALCATHLPWHLHRKPPQFSRGQIQSLDTGPVTVVNCRCDPCSGYRDAGSVRRGNDGLYGVLTVHKGWERVWQGDIACDLRPGDIMIWDSAQPITFEVLEHLEKSTLFVSKDQLVRISGSSRLPTGRLDSRRGFGALFFDRMRGVRERIEDFCPVGGEQLGQALMQDLLNAAGNLRVPEIISPQRAMKERITRVIDAQFQNPSFGPRSLSEQLGVSVRLLHKVFEDEDETIAGRIRMRRLAAVKADLEKPEYARCSITQICFIRGFSSPEHCSRSFRAQYGMSPRAYRRKCLG